jgi:hypothetical protein
MSPFIVTMLVIVAVLRACVTHAQPATPEPATQPFQLGGYVEGFYQWNFNRPSNGISNFRGFDNRHNTFTLSNIALDVQWDHADVLGRITLQVGHTASTYYLAEPAAVGSSSVNASDAQLWKYIQQAYAGYRFARERELVVTGGVFLSPIGPESMAVRDNWNWSRSNLFFALPFYHTGVRASYALSSDWSATLAAYNGWNSVVDNNREKSVSAQLLFTRPEIVVSMLYFGGVEPARGAEEGRGVRHLLDAHVTWHASSRLSWLVHVNAGIEPTRFGLSHWQAGALYARLQVFAPLFVAVRGDVFFEHAAHSGSAAASPLFWPSAWVASGTLTADYRPREKVSFRLEYRHDQAASDVYFGRNVGTEPDQPSQDTLSLGVTSWF